MPTNTPNYSFQLPTEGADTDLWGGFLNGNWSALDTLLKTLQDEVNTLRAQTIIPVGGLYFSSSDTDPATTLGYGTWEAFAAGRAIVGVGDNGDSVWTSGETRGVDRVTLTEAQIPSHKHNIDPPSVTTGSANPDLRVTLRDIVGDNGGTSNSNLISVTEVGDTLDQNDNDGRKLDLGFDFRHTHTVSQPDFDSDSTGGSGDHDNVQPSIGVYVYRRTA